MYRRKRGFAMTYAIVLILLVTLLVSSVLVTARLTAKSAQNYGNYINGKRCLDEIGSAAIDYYTTEAPTEGALSEDWTESFQTNEFNYTIKIEPIEENGAVCTVQVRVLLNRSVKLFLAFTRENADTAFQLKSYVYNAGSVTDEQEVNK